MFGPVRAVIVDDVPSHLFSISSGFAAARIPSTPYWYDRSELSPKNKLKPKPPEGGHEYLRVIFTDLNLEEAKQGLAEVIGPVINVISQLVSKDSGPYAVVFWTAMRFGIGEIRDELTERLSVTGIPLPIAIDEIAKGPFLTSPSDEHRGEQVLEALFGETYGKASSLKDEVFRVLEQYGLLCMISEWESRAIHAAGKSSNNLLKVAKIGTADGENLTDSLKKVSALVAKEAAGEASAKEQPAKAYDAAMQDVLTDSFNQSVNDVAYSKVVETELNELIKTSITINNSSEVYARLNTMFHIDANVEGVRAVDRGAVLGIADANRGGILFDVDSFCCWDEFFWEPQRGNVDIEYPKISNGLASRLRDEITAVNADAVAPTIQAVRELNAKRKGEIERKYQALKDGRQRFTDSLRWVLVEAGADCDHAQGKSRTLRYLIAAEVPAEHMDDYVCGGTKNDLRNRALRKLGPYNIDGELFYLLVSLKRFAVWQPPTKLPEIAVQYRLRKNIVDFLLNSYATWSMRPGITEYKP